MAVRLDVERALTERSARTGETEPTNRGRRTRFSLGRRTAPRQSGSVPAVADSSALRYLYQHSLA
ncbi:hypothetical protein SacmaDRAFT_5090 [Saccharomonospora marina XMU15]|uniref:Uncharacterized protein n=1 Tax=Saccharomonospora marina XMU15 TaxID=882083 RepID=H5X358_9PSEU|nr:hypothetical protein [Saccharomonospora marina]EHR53258.1 hypothetical protein SacmaDRAFT_5090 [Saccharomonospora marina XMU15]